MILYIFLIYLPINSVVSNFQIIFLMVKEQNLKIEADFNDNRGSDNSLETSFTRNQPYRRV
jgi:hypothetical protein